MTHCDLKHLLDNNKQWVKDRLAEDSTFFDILGAEHKPKYLWIGCSDARVPANTIIGKPAGDVFVHRNVGNVVAHSDMNIQTVIAYAVEFLKVEHIIVTGHYDCGAIKATLDKKHYGKVENWLYHIKDVVRENEEELSGLSHDDAVNRLCELNVKTQVRHVSEFSSVLKTWKNNQKLSIHGWIYDVKDGCIKDLECTLSSIEQSQKMESPLLQLDIQDI